LGNAAAIGDALGERVALDDDDAIDVRGEGARRAQPGDTGPDYDGSAIGHACTSWRAGVWPVKV
jgi:hypothetical protein